MSEAAPGGRDRGVDAARLVGLAGHPGRELGPALAREHQVGVRVDEAGQHGAAARVHDVVGGRRLARGAGPGHPALVDDQRGAGAGLERPRAAAGVVGPRGRW